MNARPIITLTTDFGLEDAYVASVKGVMLGIAPEAAVVDVSHEVPAHDVSAAGYILLSCYRYFPAHAIHVVVVDPGVGTDRKPVAVQSPHGTFVGPDNGVICAALTAQGGLDVNSGQLTGATAVELTNPRYRNPHVSHTFHGRDIFAPAAAHLALKVLIEELGPPLHTLRCEHDTSLRIEDGVIYGSIVHIDHFGNAVSSIPEHLVPPEPRFEVGGTIIVGLARTYQDGDLVALVGSTGLVEVAKRNGSAALALGLRCGDQIVLRQAA